MSRSILNLNADSAADTNYLINEVIGTKSQAIVTCKYPEDAAQIAYLPEIMNLVDSISLDEGNAYHNEAYKLLNKIEAACDDCENDNCESAEILIGTLKPEESEHKPEPEGVEHVKDVIRMLARCFKLKVEFRE